MTSFYTPPLEAYGYDRTYGDLGTAIAGGFGQGLLGGFEEHRRQQREQEMRDAADQLLSESNQMYRALPKEKRQAILRSVSYGRGGGHGSGSGGGGGGVDIGDIAGLFERAQQRQELEAAYPQVGQLLMQGLGAGFGAPGGGGYPPPVDSIPPLLRRPGTPEITSQSQGLTPAITPPTAPGFESVSPAGLGVAMLRGKFDPGKITGAMADLGLLRQRDAATEFMRGPKSDSERALMEQRQAGAGYYDAGTRQRDADTAFTSGAKTAAEWAQMRQRDAVARLGHERANTEAQGRQAGIARDTSAADLNAARSSYYRTRPAAATKANTAPQMTAAKQRLIDLDAEQRKLEQEIKVLTRTAGKTRFFNLTPEALEAQKKLEAVKKRLEQIPQQREGIYRHMESLGVSPSLSAGDPGDEDDIDGTDDILGILQ